MPLHGVSLDVPCAHCGRRSPENRWGELCAVCRAEAEARASKLARRVAPVAALACAGWVYLAVPPNPTARFYGGVAVLVTYLVARRVVGRVAAAMHARRMTEQEQPQR